MPEESYTVTVVQELQGKQLEITTTHPNRVSAKAYCLEAVTWTSTKHIKCPELGIDQPGIFAALPSFN